MPTKQIDKELNPRKEPTQSRSKDTVDVILTAATHILENLGFDSTTTNKIAERAGVSIGSLYQYFPNKSSLGAALIEKNLHVTAQHIEKKIDGLKDVPLETMINEMVKDIVGMFERNRRLYRVLLVLAPQTNKIQVALKLRKREAQILAKELGRRQSEVRIPPERLEGAVFILTNALLGMLDMHLFDEEPIYTSEVLAQELSDLILCYIRKPAVL